MLFKTIIKCKQCNKNYNFKNNNGTHEYICSTRKNYSKSKCDSEIIKEDFLLDLIELNCGIQNKDYSPSKIKLFVRLIEVDKDSIIVYYKDGQRTEIINNEIKFNV